MFLENFIVHVPKPTLQNVQENHEEELTLLSIVGLTHSIKIFKVGPDLFTERRSNLFDCRLVFVRDASHLESSDLPGGSEKSIAEQDFVKGFAEDIGKLRGEDNPD